MAELTNIDTSKIFFIYEQYLWHVVGATGIALFFYFIWTLRVWHLYKRYGGYENCKKLAKINKTRILGPTKLALKTLTMAAIIFLVGLSLLEPSIKETGLENEYEPSQIVIAVDNTLSMLAEDVKPSRIESAKTEIYNLTARIKGEGGKDQLALLRFTDIAVPAVAVPTRDYDIIKHELSRMTNRFLERFKTHGTNMWDAITQGIKSFDAEKDKARILIIITDGEQVTDNAYLDKTRNEAINLRSKNEDIKIFIVGIGNINEEPSLIPKTKDEAGNVLEYYIQEAGPETGQFIETRPDKQYIEEVCSQIDAKPIISQSGRELSQELNNILNKERKITGKIENPELKNLTPLFIVASLLILFFVPFFKL